jgi:chitosanase
MPGDGLNPDVAGLDGFEGAWKQAARDPLFIKAQDDTVDQTYFQPAMTISDQLGLKLPFSRAIIYDTAVMHGVSPTSQDSLVAIVARTSASLCANIKEDSSHCTPSAGFDEKTWMRAFLATRKFDMLHPFDPKTQAEWSQNAPRADILLEMLNDGDYDNLDKSIALDNFYASCVIP